MLDVHTIDSQEHRSCGILSIGQLLSRESDESRNHSNSPSELSVFPLSMNKCIHFSILVCMGHFSTFWMGSVDGFWFPHWEDRRSQENQRASRSSDWSLWIIVPRSTRPTWIRTLEEHRLAHSRHMKFTQCVSRDVANPTGGFFIRSCIHSWFVPIFHFKGPSSSFIHFQPHISSR